jgi:hypothetical protein
MEKIFAQGDLLFIKVDVVDGKVMYDGKELIINSTKVGRDKERLIIGHSETGHHHFVEAPPADASLHTTNNMLAALLQLNKPAALKHDRPMHAHPTVPMAKGSYVVLRQVEKRPQGWEIIQD